MAAALCPGPHSSFSVVRPASRSSSRFPKVLALASPLHFAAGSNSLSAFTALHSDQNSRKLFKTALKVAETDQKTVNDNEQNQAMESKLKSLTGQNVSMKALTQAYKEALLSGDEKSICEIEAMICILEGEKHEFFKKSADLISEIASLRDKFLRLNADFENVRKRSEKDRRTFTSDTRAEVMGRVLPIIDNFERVKQEMRPETEREKKINTSYQGIYKQFVEVMRSMGVSVVDTVGKPFDPSIHEAVAREESKQFRSGIVTQELCRGFIIAGRVLRIASVKVSSGPGSEKASPAAAKPVEQPEKLSNCASQ